MPILAHYALYYQVLGVSKAPLYSGLAAHLRPVADDPVPAGDQQHGAGAVRTLPLRLRLRQVHGLGHQQQARVSRVVAAASLEHQTWVL